MTMPPNEDALAARPARQPAIAVIIPGYAVAPYVAEALDSLIAQDFDDWEAVVIDDGSPDDVAAAVAPYLRDPRIRFMATANRGVSAARNRAVAATTAPLIALLDGDDRFRPNYLSTMKKALDRDPGAVFATCNALIFGSGARVGQLVADGFPMTAKGSLAGVLDRSFNVYIGSTFRREAFERIGGFDETMRGSEDLDLWVRLLVGGGHALYVDEVLGDYRVRPTSASANFLMMLNGEHRVYTKAHQALGDRPEGRLAKSLAERVTRQIGFEEAISTVLKGNSAAGVRRLKDNLPGDASLLWHVALKIWGFFPALARPFLAHRERRHTAARTSGA